MGAKVGEGAVLEYAFEAGTVGAPWYQICPREVAPLCWEESASSREAPKHVLVRFSLGADSQGIAHVFIES